MYSICSYNLLRISPLFKCQICAKSPWFLPLSPSRCRSPEAWPSEITRASEIWSTSSLVSWLISWGRVHHLTWDSWDLDFSGSSCNSMDGWMECILRTRLTTVVNFLLAAKTGELLRRDVETSRSLLQDSLCFRYCSSLVRSWRCPRASFFLHPSYHPSRLIRPF